MTKRSGSKSVSAQYLTEGAIVYSGGVTRIVKSVSTSKTGLTTIEFEMVPPFDAQKSYRVQVEAEATYTVLGSI